MGRAAAAKSIAKDEGYVVVGDAELRSIVENRVRVLESELAGHRLLLAEQEADPHERTDEGEDGPQLAETRKTVESIEARLEVVRARLAALKANTKDDAADDNA